MGNVLSLLHLDYESPMAQSSRGLVWFSHLSQKILYGLYWIFYTTTIKSVNLVMYTLLLMEISICIIWKSHLDIARCSYMYMLKLYIESHQIKTFNSKWEINKCNKLLSTHGLHVYSIVCKNTAVICIILVIKAFSCGSECKCRFNILVNSQGTVLFSLWL